MLRVGNLQRSIDFYTQVLGMQLLRRSENPDYKYSLAFVGFEGNPAQAEIELTYNWGTDRYEMGTAYGHIALGVPDAYAACEKIKAGENNAKLECFAGQYNKYEGLTVNFAEAVNGAGGDIVGDDGKPNVATPEAIKGLSTLSDWFKDGTIPKGAITWQEEQGRQAFQDGELIFHRNWGYLYNLSQSAKDSKVIDKVGALEPSDLNCHSPSHPGGSVPARSTC